jgi:neutral ceramidase
VRAGGSLAAAVSLSRAVAPALLVAALLAAAPAQAANLRAGAGRADITPQTGYYLGGWTRADRVAKGQHTRLRAKALVLERDGRKIALVSIDVFMVPGGMLRHIAERLAGRGFSERNILISASHTHSGPGGFANFPALNTAAPSIDTVMDPFSFYRLAQPEPADRQLYTFLTNQIAAAIARADANRRTARAAWGSARILGLTRNRSLEAHLANHGIVRAYGQGREAEDPGGYEHTVDPSVNVLRVDQIRRRRVCRRVRGKRRCRRRRVRVPLGAWSTFADHGTVTKSSFQYYNQDHHASAMHVFEATVRREGKLRRTDEVVNVYGNSNEGDMSAGLNRHGPAASDYVGRIEARAMLAAWRRARRNLTARPRLDLRWTRVCFCGQQTEGGRVARESQVGAPFLTGSEEERGPLFDVTGEHFEDRRAAVPQGAQGHKLFLPGVGTGGVPNVVPLLAVRVGSRAIVTIPGEGTKEVGERIRSAVGSAVAGSGIRQVVVSGLANEFVLYFTTPEEYERQHYEGGNTHFGVYSSNVIKVELARLAGTLARGGAAPAAHPFDPTNGVRPDGPAYGAGAARGSIAEQPAPAYRRLTHARIRWRGGPLGLDRRLERAFVIVQRRDRRRRWRRITDDLGLEILWTVDDQGNYSAIWDIPRTAPRGTYRLVIRANRYELRSRTFRVLRSEALTLQRAPARAGRVAVRLAFPQAVRDRDLTWRPPYASGGRVTFQVGSRRVSVRRRRSSVFSVRAPAGAPVSIAPRRARDRAGNVAGTGLRLR